MKQFQSKQEIAQYRNELAAVYKQVYLETHENDEESLRQHMTQVDLKNSSIVYLEAGASDMIINYDIPWDIVTQRAYARRVSDKTLSSLYDAVVASATEQARQAGYEGVSTGMQRYMSDKDFDNLYDVYIAGD